MRKSSEMGLAKRFVVVTAAAAPQTTKQLDRRKLNAKECQNCARAGRPKRAARIQAASIVPRLGGYHSNRSR